MFLNVFPKSLSQNSYPTTFFTWTWYRHGLDSVLSRAGIQIWFLLQFTGLRHDKYLLKLVFKENVKYCFKYIPFFFTFIPKESNKNVTMVPVVWADNTEDTHIWRGEFRRVEGDFNVDYT